MSLETHIPGNEDRLLDSLTIAGKNTASYVTERRSCTFAPQSGGNFSPAGIRLMRFNLADQQGWLDAGTLRLALTLNNKHASADLKPMVENQAGMFQEAARDRQRFLRDREHRTIRQGESDVQLFTARRSKFLQHL